MISSSLISPQVLYHSPVSGSLDAFTHQQLEQVLLCMMAFLWLLKTCFARGHREPHMPEDIQPLEHSP